MPADPTTVPDAPDRSLAILLVDDDPIIVAITRALLEAAGHTVTVAASAAEALACVQRAVPDAVLLDLMLPDAAGETLLLELRALAPTLPVLVLSSQDSVGRAVDIMKLRPADYLAKPVDPERLLVAVQRAVHTAGLARRVAELEAVVRGHERRERDRFEELIGGSPAMQRLARQIESVLEAHVTVCIHGESGTGKELVARAIHSQGPRRRGPFIAVNCGAITEALQESELFGHERGAFTGAVTTRRGVFEQAHGGTLFLDELGELSPSAQTKLLRVLQEHRVQRVGGATPIPVDVRIVTATHRDLLQLVAAGRFREDLYYRVMVFPIQVPPLRDRREDIPGLVEHFLAKHRRHAGGQLRSIEPDTLDILCRHDWPGNVRELENVVQRALVAQPRGALAPGALPPQLVLRVLGLGGAAAAAPAAAPITDRPADGAASIVPLAVLERDAIERALRALDGNVTLAARQLGIGRATLYRKLAQFGWPND